VTARHPLPDLQPARGQGDVEPADGRVRYQRRADGHFSLTVTGRGGGVVAVTLAVTEGWTIDAHKPQGLESPVAPGEASLHTPTHLRTLWCVRLLHRMML
jgi:hypothetical protein